MFNFFKSKSKPEIIQQLEQNIGRKFEGLNEIDWASVDYVQNNNNQIIRLSLYGCNLKKLPLEITKLQDLTELNLDRNQLTNLPSEIAKLQNLTKLKLSWNKLTNLPPEIGKLQNLTELFLDGNRLTNLPPEIAKLQNLTRIWLHHNQITNLSPEIAKLQNLTKLSLHNNKLTNLPPEIAKLQNLTKLNLNYNQLTNLPLEIVKLQNLTELDLGYNQLTKSLPEIVKLQNLTELNLGYNQLTNLPSEIVKLQNLTKLDLNGNQLTKSLSEIVKLQNLTELNLYRNQLTNLPSEIAKLQNLTKLNLNQNQFTQFPKALLDLNLEIKWGNYGSGITVKDNPFQTPPVEIVKQGRQAIIDYYNALKDNKQPTEQEKIIIPTTPVKHTKKTKIVQQTTTKPKPLNESKLILIGDGGAGKTSLVKRLLKQDFNPQESQTHGININTLTINDIKLHCWDFGGQQIMHATHQFFLSKRSLYLLVLDSRRETQVDYWLKHIQTFGHNAPVIIVINKIDENPHFDLSHQRQLKQNYPNLKHICRISCATQQGIDQLNQTIQTTLPDIELLNTMFPAKWFNVKTAITDQAKTTNFTSYEHYVNICQTNGITKESEQNTLINFLHDLGIINHFQDRWLRETNVINPQWLTEAIYTIINAPQLAGNGKLHRDQLTTLLNNDIYPQRKHDYIIELMKKFELCYAINDNEYLLPDLFPSQESNFAFNSELHFILEYDFLPKSVFTRFIVKMHHDILDNTYWRNGILLKDGNTTALIETNSNQLILQFAGQQKREYLAILLFIIKDINRNFHNLTITEKIGLPDNLTVNHIYLQKLAQNGQSEYIPPENPEKSYNIADLLGLVAPPSANEAMLQKILQILEAQGIEQEKDLLDHIDEVVQVNPGMFGMSIDVNALVRKLRKK